MSAAGSGVTREAASAVQQFLISRSFDAARERVTFDEGRRSMQQGWGGTFDRLADYLARPVSGRRTGP